MITALLAICLAQAAPDQWLKVRQLPPGQQIRVYLKSGNPVRGGFQRSSAETVTLRTGRRLTEIKRNDVSRVALVRRRSRGKAALLRAAIGFGIGFPVGWFTAGAVGDTNNPRFGMRMENVARFGGFFAGIGAAIGAFLPGSREVTIYGSP